jgi:hypothetical protein
MIKIFFLILFSGSALFANGSIGFRGGGDTIAADFKIIAREWASSQPSKETREKIIDVLNAARIITYFNQTEVNEMDYEQLLRYQTPVFIDVQLWQRLKFMDKVGFVINELSTYYDFQEGQRFDIEKEKIQFIKHACRNPKNNLCKKINGVNDFAFPKFRFYHLAKTFFKSLRKSFFRPKEIGMAAVVYDVYEHLDEVKVFNTENSLMVNGAFVVAMNDRKTKTIYVDKSKWNILTDEQKMNLVIHEYISVLGYEDNDYALTYILSKKLL